jgi:hypothetical protein
MKVFSLGIKILIIGLFLLGSAGGADRSDVRPPDEIQKQYIAKLIRIDTELRNQHDAFAKNYKITRTYYEKMGFDLRWGYGQIPSFMLKNMQDLANERTKIEKRVTELEKEKGKMKSDAISFYGGRMPEWLSQRWTEEEKKYLDSVNETYLQLQWSLQKSRWPEEEKRHLDFILQHYRQRQSELGKEGHQ